MWVEKLLVSRRETKGPKAPQSKATMGNEADRVRNEADRARRLRFRSVFSDGNSGNDKKSAQNEAFADAKDAVSSKEGGASQVAAQEGTAEKPQKKRSRAKQTTNYDLTDEEEADENSTAESWRAAEAMLLAAGRDRFPRRAKYKGDYKPEKQYRSAYFHYKSTGPGRWFFGLKSAGDVPGTLVLRGSIEDCAPSNSRVTNLS